MIVDQNPDLAQTRAAITLRWEGLVHRKPIIISCWLLFALVTAAVAAPALAADDSAAPALILSLGQDRVRASRPVAVTVLLANGTDVDVDSASLSVARPEFLRLYADAAGTQSLTGAVDLGGLAAHSVMSAPRTLYLAVDPGNAVSGAYTLLFTVRYAQGGRVGVLTAEKELQVDLVGAETILGVPLAFAGFVLPGLMLLIALNWFKVPWVNKENMGADDRLIFGVIISLVLLGPFSLLARRGAAPRWVQWLDLQQEISIERLGAYVAIGLGLGVLIGFTYRQVERRRKARVEAELAALKFKDGDGIASLIWKGMKLNQASLGKQVYFENRRTQRQVHGYHYAVDGRMIYVFPSFQLIASRLDPAIREKVFEAAGPIDTFPADPKRILAVAALLKDSGANAFQIAYPVSEILPGGTPGEVYSSRNYLALNASEYAPPPPVETAQAGYLLELFLDEPF